jgi:uncharacterized membrane protein
MLIAMFFIMKSMNNPKSHDNGSHHSNATEMEKNMAKLLEQNEKLEKEIDSLKRYR